MKKWLSFLLLLITLAGTIYPCCLEDECNDKEMATALQENEQSPEGACSPFFACASCEGSVEMSKLVQIVQPVIENQVLHETLVVFNLSTYSSSFWQPPRSC